MAYVKFRAFFARTDHCPACSTPPSFLYSSLLLLSPFGSGRKGAKIINSFRSYKQFPFQFCWLCLSLPHTPPPPSPSPPLSLSFSPSLFLSMYLSLVTPCVTTPPSVWLGGHYMCAELRLHSLFAIILILFIVRLP